MNPQVLRVFEELVSGPGDAGYAALICGRALDNGWWEGWIEFVPDRGGPLLRSRRETTQSSRRGLQAWASRLSHVYLEGSLGRTLDLENPTVGRSGWEPRRPHFEGPAPGRGAETSVAPDDAVLNPFLAYRREGETALVKRLERLSAADLRIVIGAFGLGNAAADPATLSRAQLVDLILRAVRDRLER